MTSNSTAALDLDLNLNLRVWYRPCSPLARQQAGQCTTCTVSPTHGRLLAHRPSTITPSADHITWHVREVFKGQPLAAGGKQTTSLATVARAPKPFRSPTLLLQVDH